MTKWLSYDKFYNMNIIFKSKIKNFIFIYKKILELLLKTLCITTVPVFFGLVSGIIFLGSDTIFINSLFLKYLVACIIFLYIILYFAIKVSIIGTKNILKHKYNLLINILIASTIVILLTLLSI